MPIRLYAERYYEVHRDEAKMGHLPRRHAMCNQLAMMLGVCLGRRIPASQLHTLWTEVVSKDSRIAHIPKLTAAAHKIAQRKFDSPFDQQPEQTWTRAQGFIRPTTTRL